MLSLDHANDWQWAKVMSAATVTCRLPTRASPHAWAHTHRIHSGRMNVCIYACMFVYRFYSGSKTSRRHPLKASYTSSLRPRMYICICIGAGGVRRQAVGTLFCPRHCVCRSKGTAVLLRKSRRDEVKISETMVLQHKALILVVWGLKLLVCATLRY